MFPSAPQKKEIFPSNPFAEATVTVKFEELPAFTVAVSGVTDGRKSQTCSVADTECVNGLLRPLMVKG